MVCKCTLVEPDVAAGGLLYDLAGLAIDAVRARLAAGVGLRSAVVEVLGGFFGGAGTPSEGLEWVSAAEADFVVRLLDDPDAVDRIAEVFLAIVEVPEEDGPGD